MSRFTTGIGITSTETVESNSTDSPPISERRRLVVGTSWTVLSTIVTVAIGLVTRPILVAYVGIDGYGVWASAVAVSSLFSLGGDLGVASALPKLVAERTGRNEPAGTLAGSSLIFALLSGGVTGSALAVFSSLIASYIPFPGFAILLQVQALQMPFNFAIGSLLALFQGGRKFGHYALSTIGLAAANLVLMIVFLLSGIGLLGVMLASGLASIILFVFLVTWQRDGIRFQGLARLRADLVSLVPFGIQLTLSILLSRVMYQVDVVVLSLLVKDPATVGQYALAIWLSRTLWILPGSISLTTYPVIAQYLGGGGRRKVEVYIASALRLSALATGVLASAIVLFGRPGLRFFFGPSAVPSYDLCLTLLVGTAILGTVRAIAPAIPAAGRPDIAAWLSGAGATLALVLSFAFTLAYGVVGTALAVSVSFAVVSGALVIGTSKYVLSGTTQWATLRRAVTTIASSLIVTALSFPFAVPEQVTWGSVLISTTYWGLAAFVLWTVAGGRSIWSEMTGRSRLSF